MGHRDQIGETVLLNTDGDHEIKPQQGQIGQIIPCQGLILQMGMQAADTPQTFSPQPVVREVRDHDLPFSPHDDRIDLPLPVHQEANLPAYIMAQLR
jgi:hypothetical protein